MSRIFLLALPLLAAAPLFAADPPRPGVVSDVAACRAIRADADRLACFDRAAAALDTAVQQKDVVVLDRQEVTKTKRSLFGFTLPRLGLFLGDEDADKTKREVPEFTEIATTLKTVRGLGYGKYSFTIDDNAVWQTTEPANVQPKAGDAVLIRKAALGSYFIRFGKARPVKGMRTG